MDTRLKTDLPQAATIGAGSPATPRRAVADRATGHTLPSSDRRAGRLGWRPLIFVGTWTASTVVLGWLVLLARHLHATPLSAQLLAFVTLLACTASLLVWLGRPPTATLDGTPTTRRWPFALAIIVAVLALFPPGILGTPVLAAVAVLALGLLWRLRARPSRPAVRYAFVLGGVAAIAGLGDWWVRRDFVGFLWGAAQLPLVLATLLAGWAIARQVGWVAVGIGPSRLLSASLRPALRSFLFGMALSLPWTLGNLIFRAFEGDTVRAWWQPLTALQPGVAEEAWGRVFVIALLFLAFRRFARRPAALLAATLLGVYWFAFLHVPGDPVSTLLLGTLFALPMAWLWLRRDLETAIGFHVAADPLRFAAAYLLIHGLWFT